MEPIGDYLGLPIVAYESGGLALAGGIDSKIHHGGEEERNCHFVTRYM